MNALVSKYKNIPTAAKASVWFVICSVLQKGIAFLTTPLFTRLMTTEQYGQVTIYNSWLEIFTIFATLNLFYGVYNNALNKYPDDKNKSTSSMLGLCSTLTLSLFVIYLLFQKWLNNLTGMSTIMTCFLFIEVLFVPAFRFWAAKQRFEYKYKTLVILTLIISLLTAGLGVPAVVLSEQKGVAKIITSVGSQVLISIVLYILIFARGRTFFDKKYWKWALAFNLPLIPHYLSSVVLNQCDRIMIDRMVGTSEAGIYGLAYTIGALIIIFNEAIMNSFTPWTYQHLKKNDYGRISSITNYLVLLVAAIALFLVIIAPELMWVLGGEKYKDGVWIIAPIALSIFFRFLYALYGNIEFYFEENVFIMIASIIIALANIVLNYLFIKMYGYFAAGFTTLVCFALYSLSHFLFSSYVFRKHTGQTRLYNNRLILLISMIVIAIGLSFMFLYDFWYIRYFLVIIGFIIAFIFKRKIISLFKQIRKKGEESA